MSWQDWAIAILIGWIIGGLLVLVFFRGAHLVSGDENGENDSLAPSTPDVASDALSVRNPEGIRSATPTADDIAWARKAFAEHERQAPRPDWSWPPCDKLNPRK